MADEVSEYRVTIPEEIHTAMEFTSGNLPGVAVVNTALVEFEPKVAFSWHLTISMPCEDLVENGMPSPAEQKSLYDFEDSISPKITANGNALFLARVTLDGYRYLHFRVYDPEVANALLMGIIESQTHSLEFEFRMEHDKEWGSAEWYLSQGGA